MDEFLLFKINYYVGIRGINRKLQRLLIFSLGCTVWAFVCWITGWNEGGKGTTFFVALSGSICLRIICKRSNRLTIKAANNVHYTAEGPLVRVIIFFSMIVYLASIDST